MRILICRSSGVEEPPPLDGIRRDELRLTKEEFIWPDRAGMTEDAIDRWLREGTGHMDDTDGDGERFCYRTQSLQLTTCFIDTEGVGALARIATYCGPLILEDTAYLEAPLKAHSAKLVRPRHLPATMGKSL
jgi:hypothetical protein